jgi:glycolate oxidase
MAEARRTALLALGAGLAPGVLITDPDLLAGYRQDEARLVPGGLPLAVALVRSTADVSKVLSWASVHGVPVVPRGAGTGLAGGAAAVAGGIVVSTARLERIRELDAENQLVVAEAGVVSARLDQAASDVGLMYAPDPSSWEVSTIGGNVATNAGGLRCVKYGVTRDAVLGLEVVLADGKVLRTGRRTVKGVAGLDLTGLFVGSEGILGVITAATLRLRPRPPHPPATILGIFPSLPAAGEAVRAVTSARLPLCLLELMDEATLKAIDRWKRTGLDPGTRAVVIAQVDELHPAEPAEAVAKAFQDAGASYAQASTGAEEGAQLLELRRLAYPATERLGATLVEDVAVPRSRLVDMLVAIEAIGERHGVLIATVAHAGDGNLHPVFVFDRQEGGAPGEVWAAADAVFRTALSLGGTLTGEHGVGALKRRWLHEELGEVSMDVHRAIKEALDPRGILNPGKVL